MTEVQAVPLRAGIRLEPFSRDNADLVLRWRNAPHIRDNSLDDGALDADAHYRFVDALREDAARHYYVVHLDRHPCAVLNVTIAGDAATWGCYVDGDSASRRPGLFPLLVGVAGALAFGPMERVTLRSEVLEQNDAPRRMNEYLGIAIEGGRCHVRASGERVRVLQYALSDADWPKVLARLRTVLTRALRESLDEFIDDPTARIG